MDHSHSTRPGPTRRQVLQGMAAGAFGLALAGGVGPTAVASAAPIPRPTGTAYVRYEDLYKPGMTLQAVIQKVPSGKILTFPEGEFTFRDFTSPVGWYDGIRITTNCRGLVGSGRGTVFKMVANSSTKRSAVPSQSQGGTNPTTLMRIANVANPVLMNFSVIGTPQGHYYNGLKITGCSNALVDGLYLRGASPGNTISPPGETMGLSFSKVTGGTLRNTEIDGRDTAGTRVTSTCLAGLNSTNLVYENVYVHHTYAGSVSYYESVNVSTTGLRLEYCGTGTGPRSGSTLNHENVSGRIRHTRPTIIADKAGSGQPGLHITLQNGKQDVPDVSFLDITHDAGPGSSGCFAVMIGDNYKDPAGRTQKQRTLPTVTKKGVTLKAIDAANGTGGAHTDRNYIRYH